MNKERVEKTKKELLDLREEILKIINSEEKPPAYSREAADEIDQATTVIGAMMGAAVSSNYNENLRKVEEALRRIETGEYGICISCEKEIPAARLKILPFTLHCIECQQELEREGES
jgi:DnaK suppressor protein